MELFILGVILVIVAVAYGAYASRRELMYGESSLRWLEFLIALLALAIGVWFICRGSR